MLIHFIFLTWILRIVFEFYRSNNIHFGGKKIFDIMTLKNLLYNKRRLFCSNMMFWTVVFPSGQRSKLLIWTRVPDVINSVQRLRSAESNSTAPASRCRSCITADRSAG